MNVGRLGGLPAASPSTPQADPRDAGFATSLERLLDPAPPTPKPPEGEPGDGGIKFSRHAAARLRSRNVVVGGPELAALGHAVDRLQERGARESLVLLGDNAFVVGVPTRTVITAMPRSEALGTVFTNIDSTYLASV
ncbi:MAG: flagellar protein [Myxococcota bacterium]